MKSAAGFAAVDCSHDIWSETIVRAFTNLCQFLPSIPETLAVAQLSDCLHIVGELHLELELLRKILATNQAQGTINNIACRKW